MPFSRNMDGPLRVAARLGRRLALAALVAAPASGGETKSAPHPSDSSGRLPPTPSAASKENPSEAVGGGRTVLPIDLLTALRLADASNPQLQIVRERVAEALARQDAARTLWLPALRGGVTFSQHTGPLQDTVGQILETDRNSLQAGGGAFAFGSGPPMLPGVAFDFQMSDALFQPLAARRALEARQSATAAAANDLFFDVARLFLELQLANAILSVALEEAANTEELGKITEAYAKSGQGLRSDADRVNAEIQLRRIDVLRRQEDIAVASARLARPLRLDQGLLLRPIDGQLAPMTFVSPGSALQEQLALARAARPELAEVAGLIGEARARRDRERFAPLVPTLSIGFTYGGFGGSGGGNPYEFADRTDVQAVAYWQIRNLGWGDQAATRERASELRQNCLRRQALLDLIAQEVGEAHAQLDLRAKQIGSAERGVEVAMDSFRRNLERIRGAQGLPIEVLQSVQARREYARVVASFNLAQFALLRATGMLFQYREQDFSNPREESPPERFDRVSSQPPAEPPRTR